MISKQVFSVLFLAVASILSGAAASAETPSWLKLSSLDNQVDAAVHAHLKPVDPEQAALWPFGFRIPYERTEFHLRGDGRVVRRFVRTRTLGTVEATRSAADFSLTVRTQLETAKILAAYSVRPDGTIVPVDRKTLQISPVSERDVYSDVRKVIIPMPAAEVGTHIVFVGEETFRQDLWPFAWSSLRFTRSFAPVGRSEILVRWDSGAAPAYATNDEDLSCAATDRLIECVQLDTEALYLDESVDSYWEVAPHIAFSREESWHSLSSSFNELVNQASKPSKALDEKAMALKGFAASQKIETLSRIHRFVADEIRYVGLEHGKSAVVPVDANTSLHRGYADCKGKVALFKALADRTQLTAEPVLVSTFLRRPDTLLLPSWLYFDHMIACVKVGDPNPLCMDLTAAETETGALPTSVIGAIALRADESRPIVLRTPGYSFEVSSVNKVRVECDGTVEEKLERHFEGAWAGILRSNLTGLSEPNRLEELKRDYESTIGTPESLQVNIGRLDEPERQLTLGSHATFKGGDPKGWTHYEDHDAWLTSYLNDYVSKNRHYPFRVMGIRAKAESVYELCPDLKVPHLGSQVELIGPGGTLTRKYEHTDKGVRVVTDLALQPGNIEPAEKEDWNRFIKMLQSQLLTTFTLESTRD